MARGGGGGRWQWKRNPCRIIQEAEASIGAYSGTKERGEAREEGSGLAGLGTQKDRGPDETGTLASGSEGVCGLCNDGLDVLIHL